MPYKANGPNVFTKDLPAPLRALVEMAFPPESLGVDPISTMMPVAPILGAAGKVAPQAILGAVDDVPVPQGLPSMPEVNDLLGQLGRNISMIPSKGGDTMLSEVAAPRMPRSIGHLLDGPGLPEFVPPGGEAAFNAARQPRIGPVHGQRSQVLESLDRWRNELGDEGLRDLRRRQIPARQVEAPPRMK